MLSDLKKATHHIFYVEIQPADHRHAIMNGRDSPPCRWPLARLPPEPFYGIIFTNTCPLVSVCRLLYASLHQTSLLYQY